jgi:hypothetical protein
MFTIFVSPHLVTPLPSSSMDSLNNTDWDVLIAGTGFYQSLLALYVTDLISSTEV